jgi:hypothetical protein
MLPTSSTEYILFIILKLIYIVCAGLPFHVHGETWLGLVHGAKRWFVYPPGASASPEVERHVNPLRTVDDWFREVYPTLTGLEKPGLGDGPVAQPDGHPGYRPLECIQRAGDVLYLPAFWSHLTVNIGEAIGIGGQTVLNAAKRCHIKFTPDCCDYQALYPSLRI